MKPKTVEPPVRVSIARSGRHAGVPSQRAFELWAVAALGTRARFAVSLLLVGPARARALNRRYRGKDKPTNVLSFAPAAAVDVESGAPLLGDLVICPQVLRGEARAQRKRVRDHWAHLFVHGLLHLTGHDHEQPADARRMEGREIRALRRLGISNPYRSH
jgi:probable rRNA maturation factor